MMMMEVLETHWPEEKKVGFLIPGGLSEEVTEKGSEHIKRTKKDKNK